MPKKHKHPKKPKKSKHTKKTKRPKKPKNPPPKPLLDEPPTTMTEFTSTGRPNYLRRVESEEVVLGDTVVLDLSTDGDFSALTHVFLGVQMFNSGGARIVDSAGTFTITIETLNTRWPESPPTDVIDATAPTTISWAANTYKITVVPDSLSDTVTYKVVATADRN